MDIAHISHELRLIGAGLIAMATAGSANANLLTNGGFDDPVGIIGSGFVNCTTDLSPVCSSGQVFNGWSIVGPASTSVSPISGNFQQSGIDFLSQSGPQWLDLTGFGSNSVTGIEQAIATSLGSSYVLSFYVGNVQGGIFGTSSSVGVRINGSPVLQATNSDPMANGNDQTWKQFTYAFTATSASTSIAFYNLDSASDNSNGLDSVSLDLSAAPVPEPANWAMMIAGFAMMGVALRRRIGLASLDGQSKIAFPVGSARPEQTQQNRSVPDMEC